MVRYVLRLLFSSKTLCSFWAPFGANHVCSEEESREKSTVDGPGITGGCTRDLFVNSDDFGVINILFQVLAIS